MQGDSYNELAFYYELGKNSLASGRRVKPGAYYEVIKLVPPSYSGRISKQIAGYNITSFESIIFFLSGLSLKALMLDCKKDVSVLFVSSILKKCIEQKSLFYFCNFMTMTHVICDVRFAFF